MGRLIRGAAIAVTFIGVSGCDGTRLRVTNASLQISPAALDFGARDAGSSSSLTVTLRNSGWAPLILTAHLERDPRSAFSLGGTPARLEPGAQAEVSVTYLAPATEGADGAALVLESDSLSTAELIISMSGRSVLPRPVIVATGCAGAPPTVAIPSIAAWPGQPRLAWNGSGNLLTQVNSPSDGVFSLEAVTVSEQGALGGPMPLMRGLDGRAAFTGEGYGLISWRWLDAGGAEVVFARLTAAATLIDGSERRFPRVRAFQTDAALAWNPLAHQFGVLWHEWNNGEPMVLRFARLGADGTLVQDSVLELGNGSIDGSGSMLTWGAGVFVALQQLGGAGELRMIRLEGNATSFTTIARGTGFHAQNVAWNGAEYGLSWVEAVGATASVKFARVSRAGSLIEGSERLLHAFPFLEAPTADLVRSGTGWLAIWAGTPQGARGDIFVARLTAAGALEQGGPFQLTCEPSRDGFPVASAGGRPTAIAFTHFGDQGSEVRTALIP